MKTTWQRKLMILVFVVLTQNRLGAAVCGPFNFCSNGYVLNGNASLLSPYTFQLTNASAYQVGSVWNPNTLDLTQSFDYSFQLNFGSNASGADGMAFVLQNDARGTGAIGDAGGELGVSGASPGSGPVNLTITPSVAVEFDTYQNTASSLPANNDPAYDHIMIDEMGNVVHSGACGATPFGGNVVSASGTCPVQSSPSSANVKDGNWHGVEIVWNAGTHVMQVYFDGSLRLTYTNDLVANIFSGNNCVYFGFSAATGGGNNAQQVRLYSCLPTPTPSPTVTVSPTPYPPGCGTPVFMQAAMIGSGCIGAGPNFSFAYNIPAAANELLVVRVESSSSNGGTLTNVQYGGIPMTLQSSGSTTGMPSNPDFVSTYYLASPPTGAKNFSFSNSSGNCNWNIAAEVYSNVNVANPLGSYNGSQSGSSNGSSTDSISITTTGPASLVSLFMASDQADGTPPTSGPGQTSFNLKGNGVSMACCEGVYGDYKVVNGPGTYTLTYNVSQANRPYIAQPIEIEGAVCSSPTNTPVPPSATPTPSSTPSSTATPQASASVSPSFTLTPSPSQSAIITPSASPSITQTPTPFFPTPIPPAFDFSLIANDPNPGNANGTYFVYHLTQPAQVTFKIYTVSGELLRSLPPLQGQAGNNEAYWDAKNDSQQLVASGAFIYRGEALGPQGEDLVRFSRCSIVRQ